MRKENPLLQALLVGSDCLRYPLSELKKYHGSYRRLSSSRSWTSNNKLKHAHQIITGYYISCQRLLRSEESNPLHLQIHIECLREGVFPLFASISSEILPKEWMEQGAHALGQLLLETVVKGAETV